MLRVATDGASALAMLDHHMPDLVLLDLKMPAVDGFAFLDVIRENPQLCDLTVIVVTALQLTSEQRSFLQERTFAVLEKGQSLEADLARLMGSLPRSAVRQVMEIEL